MLRAAQTCQILHQFWSEFCFLLFSLKKSVLGIDLHLLKLLLMLVIARTPQMEASAAAWLLDRGVQSQLYFFMKTSIAALDRCTPALGLVLFPFGHLKVMVWLGWNCARNSTSPALNFIEVGHTLSLLIASK